jgi:hypothetical protein
MIGEQIRTADSEFEQRTRALLQGSADRLSGSVRSRLTQARHAALAARMSDSSGSLYRRWMPAGALAGVALALFVVLAPHGARTPRVALASPAFEDIDMLSDSDALPLNVDQDMDFDFYEWAANEAASGSSPAIGS